MGVGLECDMNFLVVQNKFISYTTTLVFLQWTVKINFILLKIQLKINEDKLGIMP